MKKLITAVLLASLPGWVCGINPSSAQEGASELKITSPQFTNNGLIPPEYTCQGPNINPALNIEGIPQEAQSLALIVDDPDAPMGTWVHWVIFDIPVIDHIDVNSVPGRQGINDFQQKKYGGPCPPSGTHRYFFKVYALDKKLNLNEGIGKQGLEDAMEGHILAKGELIGLYTKR